MDQATSGVSSRLMVHKVTASRTVDGHFVSLSCGVKEGDPGLTLEEGCDALMEVGHELDKLILERGFVSRTMPPDMLAGSMKGLTEFYRVYMERRRQARDARKAP